MAKQYSGPNTSLIQGAAAVYKTQNPVMNFDFTDQFNKISQRIKSAQTAKQNALEAAEKEANEAYSVLSNLSFDGILPNMHMGAKEMLMPLTQNIAQNRLSANAAQNRDQKNEFSLQANMTEGVVKNIVAQLKDLSENAKEQLDFNRSEDKSAANDPAYISAINKIFSGQAQPQIIDNELGFVIDGETYKYSQLKNIDPKATNEYTTYSDSLSSAVSATTQLKQPQINAYQTKMTTMITPDNIVSLGMDDFGLGTGILGDQFETIQDWQAFVNEDYQGAKKLLAARLTDNYVSTYNNSATEYQIKNPPGGGGGDSTATGFAKNSKEDIKFAQSQFDKATNMAKRMWAAKEAGNSDRVEAIREELEKGFSFEFYSSEDSFLKGGKGRKATYYIKPVLDMATGNVDYQYKIGSKGEWQKITKADWEREMAGTANVRSKDEEIEAGGNAEQFNKPEPKEEPVKEPETDYKGANDARTRALTGN
jgi:hypothetical protein